jgi:hypothetical protein
MRPRALLPVLTLLALLIAPPLAAAEFNLLPGSAGFDVSALTRSGEPLLDAGTHPDRLQIHLAFNSDGTFSEGDLRDLELKMPRAMLVNPSALDECEAAQFAIPRSSPYEQSLSGESCPDTSQVGVVRVDSNLGVRTFGLYNLAAPYGSAEAFGFAPFGVPIVLAGSLQSDQATLTYRLENLSQAFDLRSLDLTIWGTPWEYKHDTERGDCLNEADPTAFHGTASNWKDGVERSYPGTEQGGFQAGTCFIQLSRDHIHSYVTLPPLCGSPLHFNLTASSWQGESIVAEAGQPAPLGDCREVLTKTRLRLRTDRAAEATGLDFNLEVNDGGGFQNVDGHVRSPIQSTHVFLPEGLTINPSLGAGLGVCSEADFARESASSLPGSGCPNNSKIGQVAADGLLGLSEPLAGSVYLATPYENPSHSLIELYITLASARRGIYFKSFGTIDPDPSSGRLQVSFDQLPPLHYDNFTISLREGQRAAMISPPACGDYALAIESIPWSNPEERLRESSSFSITQGEGGAPCTGGPLPFHPDLQAGSVNPNAGLYSAFKLRMTRTDSEQEITSYSATFPPGLLARLAAIPYCPEAAIEAAKSHTGLQELQNPSCPISSQIGHTLTGYGVGGTLVYAPGALFLAGPYHGAPFSILAVDSALVGPFDLGVVLVRSAIRIDPRSAQVSIDSAASDPIPHILKGIPLHLRDIRVDVDRDHFTVNPTNCDPLTTVSRLTGSGADFSSPLDDVAAISSDRFQLANCSFYNLKPSLKMSLTGATKRGRYPALRSVYTPGRSDANLKQAVVSLPNSIFLAQEHIGQICTMPQFKAGRCPPDSRLGSAKALTPLLDQPLSGPVYVRANPTHELPDLVASISERGIEIEVVARIDRTPAGGLRASFEALPDAPITRFTMSLSGGKRSLLVNAANLCTSPQYAKARFIAQNNATDSQRPRIAVPCAKTNKSGPGGRGR